MTVHWYREAVIYCLDVDTYADSDGDGVGDFRGLISRLDYLNRLGVTTLWLNPIHPSPLEDDGYDVTDFYGVHPRLGTLGDFTELLHRARNIGMRVMIDLVVNHTSDQHPWFLDARKDPNSKYRDWFVWADEAPADRFQGTVFPGEQQETWSYDRSAKQWYFHRFYDFQPDLNIVNPEVKEEIRRIVAFWLDLGVDGFRMDAVPFIIEQVEPGKEATKDFEFLNDLRQHVSWRKGDAVLLAEANVEPDGLTQYFTDAGGSNTRIHMLFDFMLNANLVLALARRDAEPIVESLRATPKLPKGGQWATFLRNHDEIDLSRLTADQRQEVFAEFGPDENMQLYGRGIRRRLAPMLGNDRHRLELAYSLQFTLRGTPVLRYGDEIGMGEDLSLDGRAAIRTTMQWTADEHGGFSTAEEPKLPSIDDGEYGYARVNVREQRRDPDSLLTWFERMIATLREAPEVGVGSCAAVDVPLPKGVLVHRADADAGSMVFAHNLGTDSVHLDLSSVQDEADGELQEVFGNRRYDEALKLSDVNLDGYGYRWFRLSGG